MKKYILMFFLSVATIAIVSTEEVSGHGGVSQSSSVLSRDLGLRETVTTDSTFINYETPHVHPIDISPDGSKLAVVNTPDGHVEIFDIDVSGDITHSDSIKVGLDPVTARFYSDSELWVINQVSDTISIIDTTTGTVVKTILTYVLTSAVINTKTVLTGSPNGDEPADVVFATYGGAPCAFVTASRTDRIQVYDIGGLLTGVINGGVTNAPYELHDSIYLQGEDPRALATDGSNVYAAIFESGNSTTILAGEAGGSATFPPNDAVRNADNDTDHPYYIDGATELGDGNIKAILPPPSDRVGPITSAGGLGGYTADGKTVDVIDMAGNSVPAPTTSLIIRKDFDDSDKWKDDNGQDWSDWVNGARAGDSGRVSGWDLLDNDVAILDLSSSLADTYATRQMNICMALNINTDNGGNIYMVGTDSTNEIRFEPNLTGTFIRVMLSITQPNGTEVALIDLNEDHLDTAQSGSAYDDGSVSQSARNMSIGDPRGVAFSNDGETVYISGMGSDNVIALDVSASHARYSEGATIEVGHGPTGIAHHPTHNKLYVVNKFGSSVSVVNTATPGNESEEYKVAFHDPTPAFINIGRVHFYGTHENSGLGQLACASCHVDGRMDRLAWDLGNPAAINTDGSGSIQSPADLNFATIRGFGDGLVLLGDGPTVNINDSINTLVGTSLNPGSETEAQFGDFHPMKGPMTTQTFQDIIGKEPHHWRGDKDGIEEFAGAFTGLQGRDTELSTTIVPPRTSSDMQEFEDFVASIFFPPNPLRPLDNTLPGGPDADGGVNPNLDMTGFFSAPPNGNPTLSDAGTPIETVVATGGDAWNGFFLYVHERGDGSDGTLNVNGFRNGFFRCVDCHTLPMGAGPTQFLNDGDIPGMVPFDNFTEIIAGPNGEVHQMVVNSDGSGQKHIKIPHTRNQLDKDGFFLNQVDSNGSALGGNDIPGAPTISRAGFGVLHDGAIDGIYRFLSEPAFRAFNNQGDMPLLGNSLTDNETTADYIAFTLAINGADFDYFRSAFDSVGVSGLLDDRGNAMVAAPTDFIPPAALPQEAHAGTGQSLTISTTPTAAEEMTIYKMTRRADEGVLALIVSGMQNGQRRKWIHDFGTDGIAKFASDKQGETIAYSLLLALAADGGKEMTFLMVPPGEIDFRGFDRDQDTIWDGDELDLGTSSTNTDSDGDNLSDGDEVNVYFTDPADADSDDDGKDDDEELINGTDPNSSDNLFVDFAWSGTESGTESEPYSTLVSATNNIATDGFIWINGASGITTSTWTGTISSALTLNSEGGTSTIGEEFASGRLRFKR